MALGWPFRKRIEHRATSYSQAVLTAALDAAGGTSGPYPDTLAVVESCTSLICDPFLVCRIAGRPIPKPTLHQMARDLNKTGNSVWALAVTDGQLELERACSWDISGSSPNPARWVYKVDISTPSAIVTRTLPSTSVIHLKTDSLPESPWRGRAPWESASLTSDALAELERGVRDESRLLVGRVWVAPDGASQGQVDGMGRTIAALRGGKQVVSETTAGGYGQGKAAAPPANRDWKPVEVGQAHGVGNVGMRESVQASLSAAYGIAGAYHNPNATAPALREVKRLAFLDRTVPLAELMAVELADKLDSPGFRMTWPNLADQSVDVHLRARGAAALRDLGINPADFLELVGLPMTLTATATTDDDREERDGFPFGLRNPARGS